MSSEIVKAFVLGVVAGFAATATMDVLGNIARRLGVVVGAKGKWIGRWYLGILRGRFAYSDITVAPERPGEGRAAVIGHYVIGAALAVLYVAGAGRLGVSPRGLVIALGYGLATCVFPWLLVYPALGFGAFGIKGPAELKLFSSSLLNHLFYGFGLWWAAALLPLG